MGFFFFFLNSDSEQTTQTMQDAGNNRILGLTVCILAVYQVCIGMETSGFVCLIIVLDLRMSLTILC